MVHLAFLSHGLSLHSSISGMIYNIYKLMHDWFTNILVEIYIHDPNYLLTLAARAEIRISLVSTRAVAAVSSKSCARIHTHTILLADCPTDKPELVASLVPYRPIKHDWHSLCCSVKE